MALFKCKMCGGALEITNNATVVCCDYCGTQQTLPKLDDDRRANLYDRANHFRRSNEFDKAMGIYEQILNEDHTDAEAYWSLVLCRFGIEYVEDPATKKRVPTVNRAQLTSVFNDENYKSALQYADGYQRHLYEEEAKAINEIQKGILAISQKEEPFDVFICYKETDNNGRRTPDSVLANDLYHQLTREGFKVFFARITLEDKLGTAYEPYIFAALNSAKVMVVLGTKPEYFNAVWVKNEWSRYLALIKQGANKVLVPAYKDMDPYDLPEEFSHLQAQDMSKLGFMQDLIHGIKKIAKTDEPKTTVVRETVSAGNTNTNALLKRAFMFLEDGDFKSADEYCEKVLDIDPENALAYLGKLMAELNVRNQKGLLECAEPFDSSNNYQKAIRFGDEKLRNVLSGCISHINNRNENARLESEYIRATNVMETAKEEGQYLQAANLFNAISHYEDSEEKEAFCREQAEICRKNYIFYDSLSKMDGKRIDLYKAAIEGFSKIRGWKDSEEQILICEKKIEQLEAEAEALRIERKRKAEQDRIAQEKRAKQRKIGAIVGSITLVVAITVILLITKVFIPNAKYNDAVELMEAGKYQEAISTFQALGEYKEAECNVAILDCKYEMALDLMETAKYEDAISAFEELNGYKDSTAKILDCKYEMALDLMEAAKYEDAISAFEELNGYKDSAAKITECNDEIFGEKYNSAINLIAENKYVEAYEALIALDGYKDSAEKANAILNEYSIEHAKNVKVGDYIFFGSYEQDNDFSNGQEAISWLVLDKKDTRLLVISNHILDSEAYHVVDERITWETCSLRSWLNNDFLATAFSSEEKALIPTVTVSADKNPTSNATPGKDTQDKVFLLSIQEAYKYFDNNSERQCEATLYAKAKHSSTAWWLRSPGSDTFNYYLSNYFSGNATVVAYTGGIEEYGISVISNSFAVRPALWIDLNS